MPHDGAALPAGARGGLAFRRLRLGREPQEQCRRPAGAVARAALGLRVALRVALPYAADSQAAAPLHPAADAASGAHCLGGGQARVPLHTPAEAGARGPAEAQAEPGVRDAQAPEGERRGLRAGRRQPLAGCPLRGLQNSTVQFVVFWLQQWLTTRAKTEVSVHACTEYLEHGCCIGPRHVFRWDTTRNRFFPLGETHPKTSGGTCIMHASK
mmetsp:Transcript_106134/g.300111  ORF Transcript_106134/g.300111 Transcript_106134/m.300111 type:complete len:212 (+) Transcript_106134:1791-2426(+)